VAISNAASTTGAPMGTVTDSTVTTTITSADTATVTIERVRDREEGTSPTSGQFKVKLDKASSTDTVVAYTLAGSATSGVDYTVSTGSGVDYNNSLLKRHGDDCRGSN